MSNSYDYLDIAEYLNVPENLNPKSVNISYLEKKIRSIQPKYNIGDGTLTRLTRYVFYIELEMYYNDSLREAFKMLQNFFFDKKATWKNPNVFIGDKNRTDYSYHEVSKDIDKDYVYHVLIDTSCPRFEKAIAMIRRSKFYLDDYIYKDLDSNKIVVRLRSICKSHINKCIRGEFSKIFEEKEYAPLTRNIDIFLSYFKPDLSQNVYKFTEESAVLLGVYIPDIPMSEAEYWIIRLGLDTDDLKEEVYKKHGNGVPELLD